MGKTLKDITIIAGLAIFLTFLIWLPHILALPSFWGLNFSNGFNTIYRNFDGLEYIIIAKTFYNIQAIAALPQDLPAQYFASHFPGYSIAIATFAPILGYLKSMLFASVLFTILSIVAFYFLIKDFKLSSQPLFLSLLFLILPARWLIVHSVGSSEPMFIFFTTAAIYFMMKFEQAQKFFYIFAFGIFGFLSQITRPPAALLFIAMSLFLLWKHKFSIIRTITTSLPLLFIPAALSLIFFLYSFTYQDFWAYFHSGDNIHLTFPPFQVFNKYQYWVGDIWLEDIILTFILGFLAAVTLWKKKLYPLSFFVLTYLTASIFVAHRDISRYILPITPFVLIAYERVLTSKEFKIILPIIAIASYLYAQNFIIENVAPIPNPYLFN